MTTSVRYILYSLAVHGLITYLCYCYFKDQAGYFIASEIGILLSFLSSLWLLQQFMRPIRLMHTGVDAIRDQDFNVKFVKTGSLEMDKLVDVYNEMIDNIRTERTQLEEQHYFLQKLIQASPVGIIILDYDGRITEINPRARKMLNLEELVLQTMIDDTDHPILQKINEIAPEQSVIIPGQGLEKFKCEASHFIHRGFHRKFVLVQELSKEILAAEKKAYGKVIRMMAHEVNNSIGAINSILDSILDIQREEVNWTEDLSESLQVAIDRNQNLNQFMKNFADVVKLPAPNLETASLQKTIYRIASLMEHQARDRKVSFTFELPQKEVWARIDQQQIEQALVNIVKNALESVPEEGTIRFQVQPSPASISIVDNGAGIDPEISDKLFSPFFSTKAHGQGVGLTLVREILANHQAQFSLKTNEDQWTEFRMEFVD